MVLGVAVRMILPIISRLFAGITAMSMLTSAEMSGEIVQSTGSALV